MRLFLIISLFFGLAYGASIDLGGAKGELNIVAILMFSVFVLATLGITYYSNKLSKSASGFYTAGGNITGFQNGMATAGDYMSAASFLGIVGLVFHSGFDGLVYSIGWLVGWPIVLFLIAEKFRNLGKFTFSDIIAYRLEAKPVRIISAISGLSVIVFYLIAQMVGAGSLIQVLFGLPYEAAVIIVGVIGLVVLSPSIWVEVLGFESAIFPYNYPAIFSMPITFIAIYIISKLDSPQRAIVDKSGFEAQDFRAQTGIGASQAVAH